MSTPLTDGINALTQYANEVTGKQDATLSDAVGSLVEGYGGGSELYPVGTDIVTMFLGRNLANGLGLYKYGTYDRTTGVFTQTDDNTDNGICLTYIPINPDYKYYKDNSGRIYGLCYYDENYNFIKSVDYNNLNWTLFGNIPTNARYLRYTTHNSHSNWDLKILRME